MLTLTRVNCPLRHSQFEAHFQISLLKKKSFLLRNWKKSLGLAVKPRAGRGTLNKVLFFYLKWSFKCFPKDNLCESLVANDMAGPYHFGVCYFWCFCTSKIYYIFMTFWYLSLCYTMSGLIQSWRLKFFFDVSLLRKFIKFLWNRNIHFGMWLSQTCVESVMPVEHRA